MSEPSKEALAFIEELSLCPPADEIRAWAFAFDRFAAQRGAEIETQIARDSFERGVEVGELLPRGGAPPQAGGGDALKWARELYTDLLALGFGPKHYVAGRPDSEQPPELVKAALEAALRSSRREGAEAMREDCAQLIENPNAPGTWAMNKDDRWYREGNCFALAAAIRSLPIPGKTDAG